MGGERAFIVSAIGFRKGHRSQDVERLSGRAE